MIPWASYGGLLGLALLILWIIWKIVTTPNVVLTVATDKSTYTRGEVAKISGNLTGDGDPVAGETVTIVVVYPGGSGAQNLSAVTDVNGDYGPVDFDTASQGGGTYTVQVTGFGANASTTFTQSIQRMVSVLAV